MCALLEKIYMLCEGLSHGALKGITIIDGEELCVSTNDIVACDASFFKSKIKIQICKLTWHPENCLGKDCSTELGRISNTVDY